MWTVVDIYTDVDDANQKKWSLRNSFLAGRICNNFLVDCALFDKSMKIGTGVDL